MHMDTDKNIQQQKSICDKLAVNFVHSDLDLRVGIADNVSTDLKPIHGLRHPLADGTSGWFIWAGDYSESEDFFKPHCIKHLDQIKPEIVKYLGLPPGHRFLVDNNGYEDIWFDKNLLDI
jgi:hypothetical protein